MTESYQQMETELTSLDTKEEKTNEIKISAESKVVASSSPPKDHKPVTVAPDDWPVNVYRPVRSTNWTRGPVKYNTPQQELLFIDRTFCQFMSGAAALVASLYGLISLAEYPWWVVSLFAVTTWGLAVGCCWDLYNEFVPTNRWFAAVKCYRSLNAAFASIFLSTHLLFTLTSDYNYIARSVPLNAWYFVMFLVPTYTGFSAFFGHHKGPAPVVVTLLFCFATQLIILISAKVNGFPEFDSLVSFSGWILLMGSTVLNEVSLLVGSRSLSLYHSIMCLTLFMVAFAVDSYGKKFCFDTLFGTSEPNFWYIFLGFVVGLFLVFFNQPLQRDAVRRGLTGLIWFRGWAKLLLLHAWDPVPLDLKKNKNQPFVRVKAFSLRSDESAQQLCLPMGEFLPLSQLERIDGSDVAATLQGVFNSLASFESRFSQSRANSELVNQIRFRPGQDGAYWFPTRLDFTGPPPSTPTSIKQAKLQGTLLEFFVWYGHLGPSLRKVNEYDRKLVGDLEGATHVIDYEWMASLEVKPDYHRCGGRAFFRLDAAAVRLHVVYLTRPGETRKIYPLRLASGETDWQFDQAEQIFLTSSYALVVVGQHAAGIHVMMNMLALALHNGFDTNDGEYFHPWRTAMHLHFFNHSAVSDSTIGYLVRSGGAFSRIFPFTTRGLYEFLHAVVRDYDFMADADLEARKAVTDGIMPEQASLVWEERYKKIFLNYAAMVADVNWKTDADVVNDAQMQKFLHNLSSNIPKGLPDRFKGNGDSSFTTKAQVVEFTASAVHIVTCRHEVYGTLFGNWAFEPSIMQAQLPLDFGPPAVNDYQALIGVTIGTARKLATKLMIRELPMPGEKTTVGLPKNAQGVGVGISVGFKYLIKNLPEAEDAGLKKAFDYFQGALNALYVDMAGNREKREMAHWFLQVTPEMLEIGAGY